MFRVSTGLGMLLLVIPLAASAHSAFAQSDGAAGLGVKGEPRQDPAKWFVTDLDYPFDAKRSGAEGTVSIVLNIDTTGRVTSCLIKTSSGNASLDQTTCTLVTRRGRFTIQKDASGRAQPYTFAMSKTWSLASK